MSVQQLTSVQKLTKAASVEKLTKEAMEVFKQDGITFPSTTVDASDDAQTNDAASEQSEVTVEMHPSMAGDASPSFVSERSNITLAAPSVDLSENFAERADLETEAKKAVVVSGNRAANSWMSYLGFSASGA